MQEKISLLYTGKAVLTASPQTEKAIYNLNIDRMAHSACENARQVDCFLSVLCRESPSKEDAAYRAAILQDFIANPALLDSLMQIFRGYDRLPEETNEVLSEIFRYGVPAGSAGMLDCAYEELYVNAHYARNVIAYFSEFFELFEHADLKSEGLCKMKSFCLDINKSKCFTELENAASKFKSEHLENYKFTVNIDFDEAMLAKSCSIAEVTDAGEKEKKNLLGFLKKNAPVYADIGSSSVNNYQNAVSGAISELSSVFSDIAGAIYGVFTGIGQELAFYKVALCIKDRLQKHGMHYCFPEVLDAEQDTLDAAEIYDMLLFNEGKNVDNIVTNDVSLQKNILARGDNNCGKTSFLRALGCTVLFAQNGLFVCAKSAKSSIRSAIFTHFSSAEKGFEDSDAAGRFEGEVKEIAAIMNEIKPYSLVLLNETFQTTAYREGAQGMKDILSVFPNINCKYVFVTHMSAIFEIFDKDEAAVLRAVGYKLKSESEAQK